MESSTKSLVLQAAGFSVLSTLIGGAIILNRPDRLARQVKRLPRGGGGLNENI